MFNILRELSFSYFTFYTDEIFSDFIKTVKNNRKKYALSSAYITANFLSQPVILIIILKSFPCQSLELGFSFTSSSPFILNKLYKTLHYSPTVINNSKSLK